MLRLVWKDVSAARWLLLAGLPVCFLQLTSMAFWPPGMLLTTTVVTGLLAFGSIAIEEIQGTTVSWCSMPLSRRQIVLGRYLSTVTGAGLGLAISFAAGHAAAWLFGGLQSPPPRPSVGAYAILLAFFLVLASACLPFLFRLGVGRGVMAFAAAAVGLLLALAGLSALFSPIRAGGPTPEEIEMAEAWLERWRYVLVSGILGIGAVLMLVSAAISVRFFEGRDL